MKLRREQAIDKMEEQQSLIEEPAKKGGNSCYNSSQTIKMQKDQHNS